MSCGEIVYKQPHIDEISFIVRSSSSHIDGWHMKVQDVDLNPIQSRITGIKIIDEKTTEITIKLDRKVPVSQGVPLIGLTVTNEAFVSEMEEE